MREGFSKKFNNKPFVDHPEPQSTTKTFPPQPFLFCCSGQSSQQHLSPKQTHNCSSELISVSSINLSGALLGFGFYSFRKELSPMKNRRVGSEFTLAETRFGGRTMQPGG